MDLQLWETESSEPILLILMLIVLNKKLIKIHSNCFQMQNLAIIGFQKASMYVSCTLAVLHISGLAFVVGIF